MSLLAQHYAKCTPHIMDTFALTHGPHQLIPPGPVRPSWRSQCTNARLRTRCRHCRLGELSLHSSFLTVALMVSIRVVSTLVPAAVPAVTASPLTGAATTVVIVVSVEVSGMVVITSLPRVSTPNTSQVNFSELLLRLDCTLTRHTDSTTHAPLG